MNRIALIVGESIDLRKSFNFIQFMGISTSSLPDAVSNKRLCSARFDVTIYYADGKEDNYSWVEANDINIEVIEDSIRFIITCVYLGNMTEYSTYYEAYAIFNVGKSRVKFPDNNPETNVYQELMIAPAGFVVIPLFGDFAMIAADTEIYISLGPVQVATFTTGIHLQPGTGFVFSEPGRLVNYLCISNPDAVNPAQLVINR